MQQLIAIVKEQSDKLKDVKKVDKKSLHKIEKLRDAVYAGTSKAKDCVLIVTEGDSAKSFSVSGLQTFNEEEQKYFGLYTLGGKILNVKNCTNEQLNKNDRFQHIREILGLKLKDDSGLRYGKVLIMADQDFDGFHIKGLVINLFHSFWKQLLKDGLFVYSYKTPVVKVFSGKKVLHDFYNFNQFQDWLQLNPQTPHSDIKYYKGLGSSGD